MTAEAPARPTSRRRLSPLSLFEALATPHGVDRYLELINPLLTVRDLRAEVTEVNRSTDDTVTLTLRPTRQWKGFQAGQFVQLTVEINGVRRTRCYSPVCSQHRSDGRIELTIKAHPQGLVSQFLHTHAAPGLVVGLSQAAGAFRLPARRPESVLLISGGSGITPVLSMLRTLCDEGHTGNVTFLHYGYTAQDVSHREELLALAAEHANVTVVLAFTDQTTGGDLHGFFGEQHLDTVAPAAVETYLCGPPGLMSSVRAVYEARGLTGQLHTEDFQPAAIVLREDEVTGAVSFEHSAITVDNTGKSLLQQAEAAGLTPENGCRMGICFSCVQVKTRGCTRNLLTGETNSDPDVQVQLCINVPVGDVTLKL